MRRTDGHEPFSFLDPGALFALAVPDVYFAKGVSVMLCLLRGVSDGYPARLPSSRFFAWVRSHSVAYANSLSRVFSLLMGDGGFLAPPEVCRYRGDQLVARQLLVRFRCGVSIAPVLGDICSADLGDSAPPLVALISAREAHIGAGRCLVHEPQDRIPFLPYSLLQHFAPSLLTTLAPSGDPLSPFRTRRLC